MFRLYIYVYEIMKISKLCFKNFISSISGLHNTITLSLVGRYMYR